MGKVNKGVKSMSMISFLNQYCALSPGDSAKMTHDQVSALFPRLKRTSFAHVEDNPRLVAEGKIVWVEDANRNPLPYIVPEINVDLCMDNNEKEVENLDSVFRKLLEFEVDGLLIVERMDNLDSKLFQQKDIPSYINQKSLLDDFLNVSIEKKGIILRKTKNLVTYEVLAHGDNRASTILRPTLEAQAIGITMKTDAIAVLCQNKELFIVEKGEKVPVQIDYLAKEIRLFYPEFDKEEFDPLVADKNIPPLSNYSLKVMTDFELENLMKIYKNSNQMAYYHIVRRELTSRKKDIKNFKQKREKENDRKIKRYIREGDYND